MRTLLHTIFKRAKEVGLTVESAEAGPRAGVDASTGVLAEVAVRANG
ncbi:MAG: hypothetical protein ABSE49_31335 [Polyangiaceae bacterium]